MTRFVKAGKGVYDVEMDIYYETLDEIISIINKQDKKIKQMQSEERLYANEIVKLNKEVKEKEETLEQGLRFRALGGDY